MDRLDRVGVVVLAACVVWTLTGAHAAGDRPWPAVFGFLAVGAAYAAGRVVSGRYGTAVPAAVVVFGGIVAFSWWTHTLAGGAGAAPLGYGNANGAFYAQIMLAAVLGMVAAPERRAAGTALAVAAVFFVVTVSTRSVGALACLTGSLLLVAVASRVGGARLVAVVGSVTVLAGIGGTLVLSGRAPSSRLPETIAVRAGLWVEARRQFDLRPLRGVGPGRFEQLNRVSRDRDLRWAHSGYLQEAAEQGAVGVGLLLALVGWGYARCWACRGHGAAAAIGAASLTAVAVHATFDHVFDAAWLIVTTAFLVGAATADRAAPPPGPGSPG